jgi:hypothetical protein
MAMLPPPAAPPSSVFTGALRIPGAEAFGAASAAAAEPSETGGGDAVVYSFYPGTGAQDHLEANVINAPIQPMWRDRRDSKMRFTRKSSRATSGRHAVRRVIEQRLIPALRAFSPDLILVSAGFDGKLSLGGVERWFGQSPVRDCRASRPLDVSSLFCDFARAGGVNDVGNSRNDGKATAGMNLSHEDYRWITSRILVRCWPDCFVPHVCACTAAAATIAPLTHLLACRPGSCAAWRRPACARALLCRM